MKQLFIYLLLLKYLYVFIYNHLFLFNHDIDWLSLHKEYSDYKLHPGFRGCRFGKKMMPMLM
jgi:hypothetical protein